MPLEALKFALRDLHIPSAQESFPIDINNKGTVLLSTRTVGPEKIIQGGPKKGETIRDSFYDIYIVERNEDPKIIDPSILSSAQAINDNGLVLGEHWTHSDNGAAICSIRIFNSQKGIVWEIGKFSHSCVDGSFLNSSFRALTCIDLNEKGQVIGIEMTAIDKMKAFLWDQQQGFTYFDDFLPIRINNEGLILGHYLKGRGKNHYALSIMYTDTGQVLTIDRTGSINSINEFLDFNDKGQLCGSRIHGDKERGFLWDSHLKFRDLDQFFPRIINNTGQMVGTKVGYPLALWSNGKIIELPEIDEFSHIVINDKCEILGKSKEGHVLLLTPK